MPLSDTAIKKSLPATDKPYTLTYSGGLYLLVMPTGGKLWRWSYRFEKKERLMALGKYPDVPLAVARARRHAESLAVCWVTGVDPMAERKKAQRTAEKAAVENSFSSLFANRWLQHWQGGVTPRLHGLRETPHGSGHIAQPRTTANRGDRSAGNCRHGEGH